MMTSLPVTANELPRSRLFWVAVGSLIALQLGAFWMLCNHQVRIAQERESEVRVHQMALADCLRYIPGATKSTCSGRLPRGDSSVATAMGGSAAQGGAMTVSFKR